MARSTLLMNGVLMVLAILGILCILSGHGGTFLNKESFVGEMSPGSYPQSGGLLEENGYPKLETRRCGLSRRGFCSRCAFEKKIKMGSFAQVTNNDLYKNPNNPNNGTTSPSDLIFYGSRKTAAQSAPLDIGRGMRVNKYHSVC